MGRQWVNNGLYRLAMGSTVQAMVGQWQLRGRSKRDAMGMTFSKCNNKHTLLEHLSVLEPTWHCHAAPVQNIYIHMGTPHIFTNVQEGLTVLPHKKVTLSRQEWGF